MKKTSVLGYLPDEKPSFFKLFLYALQQVIVMFPATVTVALITGFQVSTTIFASGLATFCFIFITGKKIPLYYGSSFAYLTAISSMVAAEGTAEQIASFKASGILPAELISYAQFGIILSGLVSIAAGLLVRFFGRNSVEKILPPAITGSVAMIIGLTLAGNALGDAIPKPAVQGVYTVTIAGTFASGDKINVAGVEVSLDGSSDAATAVKNAFSDNENYIAESANGVVTLKEKSGKEGTGAPVATIDSTTGSIGVAVATNGVSADVARNYSWIVVALVTLLSTVIYSKYLKGLLGQLPLLLGALTGCAVAAVMLLAGDINLFREMPAAALDASLWKLGDGSIFAVPAFTFPKVSLAAVIAIMPIAIATIPESTAHIYQLDIYVNDLAKKKGSKKKYNLVDKLDRNLIGDGLCDMISGVIGGPAGTNYGENISTMAISRVFSIPVLAVASIIAMVIAFFTPLIQIIYGIPVAVIGGLEIYLFGAIAAQGIAIMIDKNVDMFSSKNIAVIASIMVIGIGGNYAFGGNIPFFGMNVPCIAGAAIFGIILNAILSIGDKKIAKNDDEAEVPAVEPESVEVTVE